MLSFLQPKLPTVDKWGMAELLRQPIDLDVNAIGTACYGKISARDIRKDMLLCLYHWGDINWLLRYGVDPSRLILHFLTYDTGVINPLWGTDSLQKRVDRMKAVGIKYVVEPDFSSWADAPIPLQLFNFYKSRCVGRDLQDAGFTVIPNVPFTFPYSWEVAFYGVPVGADFILFDLQHTNGGNIVAMKSSVDGVAEAIRRLAPKHIIFYGVSKKLLILLAGVIKNTSFCLVNSRVNILRSKSKTLTEVENEKRID